MSQREWIVQSHITQIVKIEYLYMENLKSTLSVCVWYIGMNEK